MREKAQKTFIDCLALDYINSIDDHFERSKVRMILWLSMLFSIILLLSYEPLLKSPIFILSYVFLLGACFSVPLYINLQKDYFLPSKFFLLLLLASNTCLHLIVDPTDLLSTGIWFIILIMAASFILGKKWTGFFTLTTLAVIATTCVFRENQFDFSAMLGINLEFSSIGYNTILLLSIPFFLIYFVLSAFIDNKHITDDNVLRLLEEQKELNKRLKKNETKYRKIIENADDMIYELDEKGRFTFMNPALIKVTGYKMEDKTAVFTKPIVAEYIEQTLAFYKQQMKDKSPLTYQEFPIYTKSGGIIWLGQKTNMFFDANGKMLTALCLGRDITMQKETEERLIEAKERAIKASMLKAQFLSSMSHEIRTPMNAVIGLTHLLIEENPKANQVDHLNTLMFSANNLLKLINNILDFSKIEAGKIEITKRIFSIGEILKSLEHGFGTQAKEKGIGLIMKFDKRIPDKLIGDALRLSQILNNLLSNAIKFTDKGQVTLYITSKTIGPDKIDIDFIIKDTGIGIPEDKLASVFEDFIQVNDATLRQGTGLGLSITKELLALQGSTIELQSTFGQGSTFSFNLGFEQVNAAAKNLAIQQEQKPKVLYSNDAVLTGVRLLLVEDNKINQKVATNFLKKWGVLTDIADNGLIALDLVQQKQYDIVLMDLQMPVMDGIEATRAIRALGGAYLELPIIALTASAVLEVRSHAISSGLDDFVTKPFTPTMLYEKIAQYTEEVVAA